MKLFVNLRVVVVHGFYIEVDSEWVEAIVNIIVSPSHRSCVLMISTRNQARSTLYLHFEFMVVLLGVIIHVRNVTKVIRDEVYFQR